MRRQGKGEGQGKCGGEVDNGLAWDAHMQWSKHTRTCCEKAAFRHGLWLEGSRAGSGSAKLKSHYDTRLGCCSLECPYIFLQKKELRLNLNPITPIPPNFVPPNDQSLTHHLLYPLPHHCSCYTTQMAQPPVEPSQQPAHNCPMPAQRP